MTFWERSNALGKLQILDVYDFYDQPVLLACRSASGSLYLVVSVDADNSVEHWLCVAVSSGRLETIRSGELDLNTAFSHPEDDRVFHFTVPRDQNVPVLFNSVSPAELRDDWLPTPGAKIELSPAAQTDFASDTSSEHGLSPASENIVGHVIGRVTRKLLGYVNTLTLAIHPAEGDDEHVRMASFITQLESLKDVLRHTERLMYGSEGNVYYRIAHLQQESPPEITIEAVASMPHASGFGSAIFQSVLERFEALSENSPEWVPGDMDLPALLAYQAFAPTRQRHVSELVISNENRAIRLDDGFSQNIRTAIGPDDVSRGEITGSLEVVNLHGEEPRFTVFPTRGDYKVTCKFPAERRKDVVAALDQYVRVTGRLHYKSWTSQPHAVDLEEISVLSEEDSIVAIDGLRGCAKAMTDEALAAAQNALW